MTLEELEQKLPNGFHDAHILKIELDYLAATARLHLSLLVGWPDDPVPEREEYQEAYLNLTGLCFCSIDPPDPNYPFIPNGEPVPASGYSLKPDDLPALSALAKRFPEDTWCYGFFLDNWNAYIQIAAKHAEINWVGTTPRHAE